MHCSMNAAVNRPLFTRPLRLLLCSSYPKERRSRLNRTRLTPMFFILLRMISATTCSHSPSSTDSKHVFRIWSFTVTVILTIKIECFLTHRHICLVPKVISPDYESTSKRSLRGHLQSDQRKFCISGDGSARRWPAALLAYADLVEFVACTDLWLDRIHGCCRGSRDHQRSAAPDAHGARDGIEPADAFALNLLDARNESVAPNAAICFACLD